MTPALHDILPRIAGIPLENIANIARQAFDRDTIIPLWFGEGDLATPDFIGDATLAGIRAGHTFYSYQNGIPELRRTLAEYHNDLLGTALFPERITVTSGGMPAIMLAIQMLVGAGDNVIVIDPVWPNIAGAVQVVGGEVRSVRLEQGAQGWQLDVDKVARACDARTRAIFFASPGNPTGAVIPIAVQRQLLALGRERGIWILADEVYHRLVFGERVGPSILTLADAEDRVLVINSFSKSWAMTGWRLGWLVHPPSIGPTLAMLTQYATSGTTTFLQDGAIAAIRHGEPFVAEMNRYCEQGMHIVCDALETMGRVRLPVRPRAAMYVFFEIEGVVDSRATCLDILDRTGVGLAPGLFFGPGSESFFRICFCRRPDVLADAMDRLGAALA
ncbi:pyridoxal phosphate-dependent aminotransferase [Flavisphingomonas formosensis]|uniref:pyridoxal phosphate-dependent aminotransferase n=1 Tax=Flavisphingomonas formosensis TaxID=861534 RepID=UPI0012FB9F26|nr:pyridoxal phosphate-dependent aminotransferase [Sphingomonas formosensis]